MNHDTIMRDRVNSAALLSLLCSVITTFCLLLIISKTVHYTVDTSRIKETFAVPMDLFAPEPLERTLFMAGIIVMPVSLFVFYVLFRRLPANLSLSSMMTGRINSLLYGGIISATLFLTFIGMKDDKYFFLQNSVGSDPATLFLVGMFSLLCYSALLYSGKISGLSIFEKLLHYALQLLSALIIFSAFLICMYGKNAVVENSIITLHFNAVFHAMVQVFLGKELLVDLTHQYGLYPHFLEPVFRVVGLTVLNFTVLMGVLTALSAFVLHRFMRGITTNRILRALGYSSTLYFCYYFGKVVTYDPIHYAKVAGGDPYFQYHPIRFVFPVLSMYLAYEYFAHHDRRSYYLSFIAASIAVLWNFDTGFVVFASWLLAVLFEEFFSLNGRAMASHVLRGGVIFSAVFGAFTLYMYMRYGHVPDYRMFFDYQRLFYVSGYMMLPMPLVHPWNLVLLTYAAGLLYSIVSCVEKRDTLRAKMIFFLSVLGTGLFVYYQGRSHDLLLNAVCFPAIIILTIFADNALSSIKITNRAYDKFYLYIMLYFMIFSTASLAWNIPDISKIIASRLRPTLDRVETPVIRHSDFVKKNTTPGEEVLIMSDLSGIYYLDSETTCPLKIPGPVELYLVDEYQKINRYLDGEGDRKVILDAGTCNPEYGSWLLHRGFRMKDGSLDGKMTVFIK